MTKNKGCVNCKPTEKQRCNECSIVKLSACAVCAVKKVCLSLKSFFSQWKQSEDQKQPKDYEQQHKQRGKKGSAVFQNRCVFDWERDQ